MNKWRLEMAKAQRALRLNMLRSSFLMFQMKLTAGKNANENTLFIWDWDTENDLQVRPFSSVCHQLRSIHLVYICIFIYLLSKRRHNELKCLHLTVAHIGFHVWSYIDRCRKPKQTNKQNLRLKSQTSSSSLHSHRPQPKCEWQKETEEEK